MTKYMVFHCSKNRISVGVSIDPTGVVKVAFSACHPKDQFKRSIANMKIRGRLDSRAQNAILSVYEGKTPGKDIYGPVRDFVRSLPSKHLNVRGLLDKLVCKLL